MASVVLIDNQYGGQTTSRKQNSKAIYSDEVSDSRPNIKKKSARPDKDLYEIEIKEVDRVANKVKIHFTGYSDKYDEWRPYDDASLPIV